MILTVSPINDRESCRSHGLGFIKVDDDGPSTMIYALDAIKMGGRACALTKPRIAPMAAVTATVGKLVRWPTG